MAILELLKFQKEGHIMHPDPLFTIQEFFGNSKIFLAVTANCLPISQKILPEL